MRCSVFLALFALASFTVAQQLPNNPSPAGKPADEAPAQQDDKAKTPLAPPAAA
jgi:hypothetical protein